MNTLWIAIMVLFAWILTLATIGAGFYYVVNKLMSSNQRLTNALLARNNQEYIGLNRQDKQLEKTEPAAASTAPSDDDYVPVSAMDDDDVATFSSKNF